MLALLSGGWSRSWACPWVLLPDSLLRLDVARQEIDDLLARADNPKALQAWVRRQEQWAEQDTELDAVAALEAFEPMVAAEVRPRKRRSR